MTTSLVTIQTPAFTATVPDVFAYSMQNYMKMMTTPNPLEQFAVALELFVTGLPNDKHDEFACLSVLDSVAVIEAWLKASGEAHGMIGENK